MITFDKVRKSYAGRWVLDEVSFHVFPGEKAGLVGPNGAGKTTLLRCLMGEVAPDKGTVQLRRGIRTGLLRQEIRRDLIHLPLLEYASRAAPALDAVLERLHEIEQALADESGSATVPRERLVAELGRLQHQLEGSGYYEFEARAKTALGGLGFDTGLFQKPLQEFSGGWQMRAELVRTLVSDPDLLLLDEPSNYLDAPAVEWLRAHLEAYRGTMILISHDRYLLNELTTRTYELINGQVTPYDGNYDAYQLARAERARLQEARAERVQAERERLESFINRFKAKATKATQAQSRVKKLAKLEDVALVRAYARGASIRLAEPPRASPVLVELQGVGKSWDGGRHWLYQSVDLSVENGLKIGIVGTNGVGKTTLMRILAGTLTHEAGSRRQGHNVKIGYHSQDYTQSMDPSLTVLSTARAAAPLRLEQDVRNLLGGFGFVGEDVMKEVKVLSGGEKVRLSLAKLLLDPPNILLLDEPTTHLDIQTREALQDALAEFSGTVILVSHDIEFLRGVAEMIVEIRPGGVRRFYGDYDEYREKIALEAQEQQGGARMEIAAGEDRKDRRRREAEARQAAAKRKAPLEKEIASLEARIAALEKEEHDLAAEFALQPGGERIRQIQTRLAAAGMERKQAEDRWESACAELETLQIEP